MKVEVHNFTARTEVDTITEIDIGLQEDLWITRIYNELGKFQKEDANIHLPEEGCREKVLATETRQITMQDIYGDGSNHVACTGCGFCIECGDCTESGCGEREQDLKSLSENSMERYKIRTGENV